MWMNACGVPLVSGTGISTTSWPPRSWPGSGVRGRASCSSKRSACTSHTSATCPQEYPLALECLPVLGRKNSTAHARPPSGTTWPGHPAPRGRFLPPPAADADAAGHPADLHLGPRPVALRRSLRRRQLHRAGVVRVRAWSRWSCSPATQTRASSSRRRRASRRDRRSHSDIFPTLLWAMGFDAAAVQPCYEGGRPGYAAVAPGAALLRVVPVRRAAQLGTCGLTGGPGVEVNANRR